jgi:hypothetical protein
VSDSIVGRYRPKTREVMALVAELHTLTPGQVREFTVTRYAGDATAIAWNAARNAAHDAGDVTGTSWIAAQSAWVAAGGASWAIRAASPPAVDVPRAAALALATRHLVGQYGYTQSHYDALTGRVAEILGHPLHPDDQAPATNRTSPGLPEDQP